MRGLLRILHIFRLNESFFLCACIIYQTAPAFIGKLSFYSKNVNQGRDFHIHGIGALTCPAANRQDFLLANSACFPATGDLREILIGGMQKIPSRPIIFYEKIGFFRTKCPLKAFVKLIALC